MIDIDDRNWESGMSPIFLPSNFIDPYLAFENQLLPEINGPLVLESRIYTYQMSDSNPDSNGNGIWSILMTIIIDGVICRDRHVQLVFTNFEFF